MHVLSPPTHSSTPLTPPTPPPPHRCCRRPPPQAENDEALLSEQPVVPFSGEECMGRFLDLHELFQSFVNAKFGKQVGRRAGQAA